MMNEDIITGTICAVIRLAVAFVLLAVTGEDTTVDENTLKCSTSSYVSFLSLDISMSGIIGDSMDISNHDDLSHMLSMSGI